MEKRIISKRTCLTFFVALAVLFVFAAPCKTADAVSSGSLVMVLVESHDSDKIEIQVRMIQNTGVSAMTLELVYDKNVFDFIDYEKGPALSDLDLISTDLGEDKTLPIKFNWLYKGNDFKNDESVGTILILNFKLKDNVESGKYAISFNHGDGDIAYVDNGNVEAKSAIISQALVTVSDNAISGAEIVDAPQYPDDGKDGGNALLIVGIIACAVAVAALATVLIIKFIKKKRGKGNWSEV